MQQLLENLVNEAMALLTPSKSISSLFKNSVFVRVHRLAGEIHEYSESRSAVSLTACNSCEKTFSQLSVSIVCFPL
jgi:hypothetical protein